MNRHDRRAADAARPPAGYLRCCDWLDARVGRLLAEGDGEPRFVLPPRTIALVGDLGEMGGRIARNAAARKLVAECHALTGDERPTIVMLAVVLERRGIDVERVTLDALGLGAAVPYFGRDGAS